MLTIYCGEDAVSSRKAFVLLKEDYLKKNFEIKQVAPSLTLEINLLSTNTPNLFGQKSVFFTEYLNKLLNSDSNIKKIKEISQSKEVILVNWEEKSSRELKIKQLGETKEFKPSKSIFKLLDNCYPKNLKIFITLLNTITKNQEEGFIFIMLTKHIKNLLLAKLNQLPKNVFAWQKYKLLKQGKDWDLNKLLNFYEGLTRIDSSIKTSNNPYGIKKSLEILSCYYLVK